MKIFFSDLDGTLLDHFTYSYEDSLEGINILKRNNIPLVPVSSKTFPEMVAIQEELDLSGPFVFENGGGIAFPDEREESGYRIELQGKGVESLKGELSAVESKLNIRARPLLSMDEKEISELTGLPLSRADLVKKRMASVPFVVEGNSGDLDLLRIDKVCRDSGITITKGGRFYHLLPAGVDKGAAVKKVAEFLIKAGGAGEATTIGTGDSENDLPMLRAVDVPFLVRRHDGSAVNTDMELTVTEGIGPAGFTEAVKRVIIN